MRRLWLTEASRGCDPDEMGAVLREESTFIYYYRIILPSRRFGYKGRDLILWRWNFLLYSYFRYFSLFKSSWYCDGQYDDQDPANLDFDKKKSIFL